MSKPRKAVIEVQQEAEGGYYRVVCNVPSDLPDEILSDVGTTLANLAIRVDSYVQLGVYSDDPNEVADAILGPRVDA